MANSSQETVLSFEDSRNIQRKGSMSSKGSRESKHGGTLSSSGKGRRRKERGVKKDEDSGFGTCSECIFNSESQSDLISDLIPKNHEDVSESQESDTSLESVSLLQAACSATGETRPTCSAQIIPTLSDEGMQVDDLVKVDKCVQTSVPSPPTGDETVTRNMEFISSMIKLRRIIPRSKGPTRSCGDVLREVITSGRLLENGKGGYSDEKEDFKEVSPETAHYIVRTELDDVLERSVDSVLLWLKKETLKGWRNLCDYWCDSVRADAVDLLNEAVDSGLGLVRKKVSDLLTDIFDEIASEQDSIEECRVSFLLNACKSIFLVYDLIVHISNRLKKRRLSFSNKSEEVATVKWMYFSLRLLADLLRSLLDFLNDMGIEEIVFERVDERKSNVLEMWRANWKNTEMSTPNIDARKRVKEAPLLSSIAQKCSSFTQEIFLKFKSQL